MRTTQGLDSTPNPSPLYVTIRNMAMEQVEVLDEIMRRKEVGKSVRVAQMRTSWADTSPAVLDLPFTGLERGVPVSSQQEPTRTGIIVTRHVDG